MYESSELIGTSTDGGYSESITWIKYTDKCPKYDESGLPIEYGNGRRKRDELVTWSCLGHVYLTN